MSNICAQRNDAADNVRVACPTGAVGVVSIPWVVRWWSGRRDEQGNAGSQPDSMEIPLRRGSLEERSLKESEEQEERELAVCALFEESFREWLEQERASATTMEETPRCRENRDEDGGEYTVL